MNLKQKDKNETNTIKIIQESKTIADSFTKIINERENNSFVSNSFEIVLEKLMPEVHKIFYKNKNEWINLLVHVSQSVDLI